MSSRMGRGPLLASLGLFIISQTIVSQTASAQAKVAVISLQRAVLESAEIKAASAAMEGRYKPRVAALEQLDKEIAAIAQQLQTNAGKLTAQAESELNAQGTKKQREATRLRDDLQADVDRERNEILQRSGAKMTEVVKKLAEEKGFDVVIDQPYVVYFKGALDITNDAIAAYDKAHPAAAPAPAK